MTTASGTGRSTEGAFDRARSEYENTDETKSGFRTSEFLASIIAALGVLIATLIEDEFSSEEGWRLVTALAIGYMLSRGIAKAGVGRGGRS